MSCKKITNFVKLYSAVNLYYGKLDMRIIG